MPRSPDPTPPPPRGPRPVRVLPDPLIDQIAAGEVVERPASVVKELVENALDAGASRIRVELRDGGRAFIAVSDDGWGLHPGDARLALQRHATSKVQEAGDLQAIDTFGFRGEALPSIAAVSKLRLRSRPHDVGEAFEIRVEGGGPPEERAASGPPGTRVEVAELFGNVPARRKFLKSAATEWGHVADWLARVALAAPEVHFEVRREDRPAFGWPAVRDPLDRIAAVLSEEEAAALVAREGGAGPVRLQAFVSRPEAHRPTAAGIHLFVNRRPVRDRLLRHALLDVYRDVLPRGRFPTALLFLDLPPGDVDVNVHPAKWEVRFADPQAIHGLVRSTLSEALGSRRWLSPPAPSPGGAALSGALQPPGPTGRTDWMFAREGAPPGPASEAARGAPVSAPLRFGDLRPLGQLLGTYLLLEAKDGLLLVDQHAAHERVLYERLRSEWRGSGVARQGLLAAEPIELDTAGAAALFASTDLAAELGFEIEPFGERTVVLRAMPALLAGRDPVPLLRGLAEELRGAREVGAVARAATHLLDRADALFASLACHSARRAGEVLDPREQQALLRTLDAIPWAPTCPHGRPVAIRVDLAEIERRFGRR